MKKELDRYDMLVGLGEYDEWSYCEQDKMWYEDKKEVLPQPPASPDIVTNFKCEIKIDYSNFPESTWEEAEKDNDIESFVQYLIDGDICDDAVRSVILFQSEKYQCNFTFNQDGMAELDKFIQKLNKKEYAAQYIEDHNAIKLLGWKLENNQVRFAVQSYHHEFEYLKIIFDIIIDKDTLISKLKNIINTWKETIYAEIKKQEKILNKPCTNPHQDRAINYFFPEYRTPVKKIIETTLGYYEREYGIKILFAVEVGSRSQKTAAPNSNYNIRFVYKRQEQDYLAIEKPGEILKEYYNEVRQRCYHNKAFIDLVGYDIVKFTRMLAQSNPTAIEWLMSDIIYTGSNDLPVKQYILENFNPKSLIGYYISSCKKNYNRYIIGDKQLTYKTYFFMIRAILNAIYVYKTRRIPPLDFNKTVKLLKEDIPLNIYKTIKEIINIKTTECEKDTTEHIPELDTFIETYLNKTFDIPERNLDCKILNNFMSGIIMSKNIKSIIKKPDTNTPANNSNPIFWILLILLLLILILTIFGF